MDSLGKLKSILPFGSSQQPENGSKPAGQQDKKKKVLVVEDETALMEALELKFKTAGYDVLKAVNGQIGLEMAVNNKPDIIILDLMMPVMDGKTMLRRLREIPEFTELPVIVLTNAGEVDNFRETNIYSNANGFFIKSNTGLDELLRKVNELTKDPLT